MTEAQMTEHCTNAFKEFKKAINHKPPRKQFIAENGDYLRGTKYQGTGVRYLKPKYWQ